jgi:hypothetical protein
MNHTIPLVAALIWMRGSGDVTSPLRLVASGNAVLGGANPTLINTL